MSNRPLAALALGGAALAFLFVAHALADECKPLADAKAEISHAGGGKLKTLSREQLMFARGLFVASPPVTAYPHGEDGMIAMSHDGASMLLFVEGDKTCGKILLSPTVTTLLVDLDKSI